MIITEPVTMLTDYAIAAEASIFVISLFWLGQRYQQLPIWLWTAAFGATAIAAALGGTCHGFALYLQNTTGLLLWRATIYALSCAGTFMLLGTVINVVPRRLQVYFFILVSLKSLIYLWWAATHRTFTYVLVDYLTAMAMVLTLQLFAYRRQPLSTTWIVGGIVVSCIAASVLWTGLSVENYLNSNDLYHIVQMIALYLFYRGAYLLSKEPSQTQFN